MSISLALTSGLSSDNICMISVSSLKSDWDLNFIEGASVLHHLFLFDYVRYSFYS